MKIFAYVAIILNCYLSEIGTKTRRRRNNAAPKWSREKRRLNDMLLEKRVVQLSRENHILRAQVTAVFKSYGYLSKIGTKTRENTKNLSINCFLDAFSLRSFRT